MAKKGKWIQAVMVVVIVVFVVVSVSGDEVLGGNSLSVSEGGYSTAFEGPKVYFHGVDYNGKHYTSASWHSASLHTFNTVVRFDSDGFTSGRPNIIGEETSVFVPSESLEHYKDWVPMSWFGEHQYIQNPVDIHEWTIDDEAYYMEEWLMRYYVTFSGEWDTSGEQPYCSSNVYRSLELWMEWDIEPTWYIQGGGTAYFAVGKVRLAHNADYSAKDVDGHTVDVRNDVSISPESVDSLMFLHYNSWGTVDNEGVETDAYNYKGRALNPEYFRDRLYTCLYFNNFGVANGYEGLLWYWEKGDTVTVAFDVTVFVIGEWNVQDIEDDPDIYGRFTRSNAALDAFYDALMGFFTNPFGSLAIIFYIIIGLILLMVFVPGAAKALLGGGKKGGGLNTIIILVIIIIVVVVVLPRLFGG